MFQIIAKSIVYLLWSIGAATFSFVVCLLLPRISHGDTIGSCPVMTSCNSFQEIYLGIVFIIICLVAGPRCKASKVFAFILLVLFSQSVEWRIGHGFLDTLKTIPIDPLVYGGLFGILIWHLTSVSRAQLRV